MKRDTSEAQLTRKTGQLFSNVGFHQGVNGSQLSETDGTFCSIKKCHQFLMEQQLMAPSEITWKINTKMLATATH